MFDWFRKLFGEGYIFSDIVCADGVTGRVKTPFIGDPATFELDSYIQEVKDDVYFKSGKTVVEVKNTRFSLR